MQTVILNGARSGDLKVDEVCETLALKVQSLGKVEVFNLRDIKIADCMGCFGCWIKTPGICVIDDSARTIANKFGKADLKVYVTPIVFGGYSYELKKLLDRQICNILPFMKKNENRRNPPPSPLRNKHKIYSNRRAAKTRRGERRDFQDACGTKRIKYACQNVLCSNRLFE